MAYYDGRFKVAKDGKHLKLTDSGLGQYLGLAAELDELKSSLEKVKSLGHQLCIKRLKKLKIILLKVMKHLTGSGRIMKLFNIPYYIDLEGQTINGVTLKSYHVKLLGVIIVHDKLGNGCFASTEKLSEEAKLTVGTVKNARADLIKAGIIKAEKGKMGDIKSLTVEEVVFQGRLNHSSLAKLIKKEEENAE